jgi:ABC-2 type transport system permease protein
VRSSLAGFRPLVRLIVRSDRFIMPLWVLAFALIPTAVASAFAELYPTEAQVAQATQQFGSNPAFNGLLGPIYGDTLGSLVAWRNSIVFIVIAVVSLLTVIRHTRVDEETGRRELLGSTVVGRHAPLTAALAVVVGVDLVIGALIAATLPSSGLPVTGSIALGLAMATCGIAFAAVGAVAAQVTETAGGARGIGIAVLALAFVLRAAGDSAGENGAVSWMSWLSPFGWAQRVRPYAGERWWVFGMLLVFAAVAGVVAYVLSVRRDVGSGILPARLGPASASPRLASPLALAWRLHRGLLLGWTGGLAVLGIIYGSVADGVADLIGDNPDMMEIFERLGGAGVLIDLYLSGVMSVLALIATGYAVQATLRLRVEEEAMRAEPVLATSVGRLEWVGSHLVFAFAGPTLAVLAAGLTTGLTYGAVAGDVAEQVPRLLGAAAAQLPAMWMLVAVTVVLFGVLPRFTELSWVAYGAIVLITFLGAVLGFDQWVLDLSPFTHVPTLPGGELLLAPLAWLLVVGALLVVPALGGFRRRDIG